MYSIFLIEARQICWSTFLRYALYNLDSRAIIWLSIDLNLGRIRKFIPPPLEQGGGVYGTQPEVFDMLQYFETI